MPVPLFYWVVRAAWANVEEYQNCFTKSTVFSRFLELRFPLLESPHESRVWVRLRVDGGNLLQGLVPAHPVLGHEVGGGHHRAAANAGLAVDVDVHPDLAEAVDTAYRRLKPPQPW